MAVSTFRASYMSSQKKYTPFQAYTLYIALKNHFSKSSYDYFKYNGQVRAKQSSLDKRNDRYFFTKLSKQKDPLGFLVANIIAEGPEFWVGELNAERAQEVYVNWVKRQQSQLYMFKQDLDKLFDGDVETAMNVLRTKERRHPPLLQFYLCNDIHIDTLVIIDECLGFRRLWDQTMKHDPIWQDVGHLIRAYKPFIKYDVERFRPIMSEYINGGKDK